MSSGNYKPYQPESWFDYNRNAIISAHDSSPKMKRVKAKIKKLKTEIKRLYKVEGDDWDKFCNKCVIDQKIPKRKRL